MGGYGIPPRLLALVEDQRAGGHLVLIFDCDGTLVPYAAHPSLARLPGGTRRLLQDLSSRPRVTVGIVSSRDLEDLRGTVGLPGLWYTGSGGLDHDFVGTRWSHPDARELADRIGRLAGPLADEAGKHPGAWVERQRLSLAVHYRGIGPERVEDLSEGLARILAPSPGAPRVVEAA